jgi:nucleotide-binding universal stress UspA family protein
MERIWVATDGSKGGARAVAFAAHIAAGLRGKLTVLTISNPLLDSDLRKFAKLEHATLGDMIDVEAEEIFQGAAVVTAKEGVTIDKCESLVGDPAELLLEAIARERPDMIVVGKRGRGQLSGLLLGSISQKLVSLSVVPVIVVP